VLFLALSLFPGLNPPLKEKRKREKKGREGEGRQGREGGRKEDPMTIH